MVQADKQWPGTEVYRDKLLDRFGQSVFQTKHSASIRGKAQAICGDHASIKVEEVPTTEAKAQKLIRAVGLRKTLMAEKLTDFQGFPRECTASPQWITQAFSVPKPGNNKWRL